MVKKETKKTFEPKTKADAQVVFDEEHPESFSEFEYLSIQVEVLKESVERLTDIIRSNNIIKTQIIEAEDFDDDEVFKRLEKEE